MTNKQKIEALEKGIKSSVTPEPLKEKMRTQLAQLKSLEKESTSDKKPIQTPSNEDVLAILYNADSKGWNATKAESGGDIKASDELTEKYANAVSKALKGIKKGSLSEEIFDELTDGNNHLLNEFLVWNGYYDAKTTATNKASYQRIWDKGNRQVANPEIISLGAFKTSDELKVGQKYKNKKGDILTIKDFDVENHVTTNDGKGNLSSEAITRISTFKELIKDGELVLVSDKKIKPSSATPIKKATRNYYRNKEIKSVTVLENGKKVTYAGKDVLNGANFFKEGGALVSKAKYVPIRNIVEVTFEDGSKDKPRNGYHIKNGATPIMEHGGVVNYEKGKTYPVKKVSVAEGEKIGLDGFPNFHKSGSISGMKKQYYGKDALLIQSGNYIYNVTSEPEIYFRYEHGGEIWQPIVQLVPLELEPLSSQLKSYTGDALSAGNYTNEEGKDYSTAPGEIIVHKESGRKFEMPEKIYNYVDGFNLVFDKRNNKIVTWEEGKLVAVVKDGKLDFTNKDESISINKSKVESEFEKGFIPEKTNEKWAYIAVENKLQKLYAIAEDLEDDKTSAAWKTNQEKIKKFEDYLHRLERKYAHGGSVELPEGSLQHFQNYYLEKGGKVDKEYSLIGTKVKSDIRKQSGYVTGYNGNYVDVYYPSLEFGESVLYKGKDQQNVMVVKDKPSLILNSVLKEDEFDNYFIEEIVEESTPIDEYEVKDSSSLIVLLRPKVSYKNDVFFGPIALIVTQKGFVYKIDNATFDKWDEIVKDAETDKLTDDKYGYIKVGNFLKEEYKLGGQLLGAWKRERKYVNKSEDYEVRYAKGKNRSGYKKLAKGGEVGDYAKVPVGYNMTHYGLIKKVITNDVLYPENGYEIAGIGDILHPEQFEIISSAEFSKLKKQGTEVKPNHFLIIEEKLEVGGPVDNKFNYMMLSRLQMDCDYYLGFGNRNEKVLWAGNVDDHIDEMKRIWNNLPKKEKPEWLSMEDILEYEKKMKSDKFEKGGVLSKGDEVYIFELRKNAKVISIKELNDFEDEIIVELADGTKKDLRSSEVMKAEKLKVNPPYNPNSNLTEEEWKAKHNIQNYGKGGSTEKGKGKGAIFAIAKEIRKPGEKWQDAVARAGKLNK